jgi:hypothetical protein
LLSNEIYRKRTKKKKRTLSATYSARTRSRGDGAAPFVRPARRRVRWTSGNALVPARILCHSLALASRSMGFISGRRHAPRCAPRFAIPAHQGQISRFFAAVANPLACQLGHCRSTGWLGRQRQAHYQFFCTYRSSLSIQGHFKTTKVLPPNRIYS